MNEELQALLKTLPPQPPRQDSTDAQLRDLRAFANRLGMYDAADLIRNILERDRPV
jgi:hypothetical protein